MELIYSGKLFDAQALTANVTSKACSIGQGGRLGLLVKSDLATRNGSLIFEVSSDIASKIIDDTAEWATGILENPGAGVASNITFSAASNYSRLWNCLSWASFARFRYTVGTGTVGTLTITAFSATEGL